MSGYVAGRRSLHNQSSLAVVQRDELEILQAIRNGPQSTADLAMVCNMGQDTVQRHCRNLLRSGRIERETVTRIHKAGAHVVGTGRYKAVV